MFKCLKCNKEFNAPSKLERHKNNKIPCNKPKEDLKCELCNVNFARPAHKLIHETSEKHIKNYNKINNIHDDIKFDKNELNIEKYKLQIQQLKYENKLEIEQLTEKYKKLKNENQELNNKIKFLEVDNQNLKNNNDIHSDIEYIYIIHCAQHINTNIYKVGRTKDILRRYTEYPKGSKPILTLSCDDSKLIETKILNYLKENNLYFQRKDLGNEYFQCDINILKSDIQKIVSEN